MCVHRYLGCRFGFETWRRFKNRFKTSNQNLQVELKGSTWSGSELDRVKNLIRFIPCRLWNQLENRPRKFAPTLLFGHPFQSSFIICKCLFHKSALTYVTQALAINA
jgi:hypothetical protein